MRLIFMLIFLLASSFPALAAEKESSFDRILRTNTIRCGYVVYAPQIIKDPNTKAISGLSYELMERMGHDLHLKIEWAEEVGPATWAEGLKSNRYDVVCNTAWATTTRAPHMLASVPAFFTAVNAYVRQDDHRFDKDISLANNAEFKISTIDGGTSMAIAADSFPLATTVSLPDLTDFSQLLLEVSSKKTDLTFSEAAQFVEFDKKNPGLLRNATPDKPVRLVQNAFFAGIDEHNLIAMLNLALQNLINDGFVDKVLDKYEPQPGVWRRVAIPYR